MSYKGNVYGDLDGDHEPRDDNDDVSTGGLVYKALEGENPKLL